jgi:Leucine Rich repeat
MIADMIKLNRNLKVLNLSKNSFNVNSARVISKAIVWNEHLYHIDLSCNKLQDEGIALLVYPIAQQSLRKSMYLTLMPSTTTAKKPNGWLSDNEKEMNIKILNLAENEHEKESLKHVLALLYANKHIVVDIDTPKTLIPEGKTAEDMQKMYVTAANNDAENKQTSLVTLQGGATVSGSGEEQK